MKHTDRIEQIHHRLQPLRTALVEHSVYRRINGVEQLRIFMEHHVFAVWDFMSLLKVLQRELCGAQIPWTPPRDATSARFVNEIVLGEETDRDRASRFASHFDLYRQAMRQCDANTATVDRFIEALRSGATVSSALQASEAPPAAAEFVRSTFALIERGDICATASAFAFGREDLLPDVFRQIVDQLNRTEATDLDDFQYYLSRHIELDEEEHGPMAARLISSLCGEDDERWHSAEAAAMAALEARIKLWDAMPLV